jgi:hypothetical protein
MQTETDPVTLTARDRAYVFRRFCHPRIAVSLGFHLLERIGTSIPRAPHLATRILTTAGGSRPDSSAHAGILRTARPAHRCRARAPVPRRRTAPGVSAAAGVGHYASDRSWPILLKNSKSQARQNSVEYRGNQKFDQASPHRRLRTSYIATQLFHVSP